MINIKKIILIKLIFSFSVFPAYLVSEEFYGEAKIIDGDTVHINNKKIRLFGIDAPEKKQKCKKTYLVISIFNFKKNYDCGSVSTNALRKKIAGKSIKCISSSKDKYKRYIAICYLEKSDLNRWMVKNGHAVAYKKYSKKYVVDEDYAKEKKLGLWSGSFIRPEKWRRISN